MATKMYSDNRRAVTEVPCYDGADDYDINQLSSEGEDMAEEGDGDEQVDLQNYKGIYANDDNN
jgi:hypothetical protein